MVSGRNMRGQTQVLSMTEYVIVTHIPLYVTRTNLKSVEREHILFPKGERRRMNIARQQYNSSHISSSFTVSPLLLFPIQFSPTEYTRQCLASGPLHMLFFLEVFVFSQSSMTPNPSN
jgi:hypothetical protein